MRRLRRHVTIIVAFTAAALNVLAPVFAYAIGQPLHELQRGYPAGAHAAHRPGDHAMHRAVLHAMQHHGAHAAQDAAAPGEPAAPHCPYCLDFAAGVPLGSALPVVPAAQPGHSPLPESAPFCVSARPSVRLARSRAPPLIA